MFQAPSPTLYHWRLRTISDSPFFPRSPWLWLPYNAISEADVRTRGGATAVSEGPASPAARGFLEPNIPNPFAAQTQLAYTISNTGWHRLAVYDVMGRQVALLAEEIERAGRHTMTWNGNDQQGHRLAAGIYFLKLELGDRIEARKVVLTR
jgi:FlgD Ig-like domain